MKLNNPAGGCLSFDRLIFRDLSIPAQVAWLEARWFVLIDGVNMECEIISRDAEQTRAAGCWVRAYVSTAWWCPYNWTGSL